MAASGGRQDKVLRMGASEFKSLAVCAVGLTELVGALQDERLAANNKLAAAMKIGALKKGVCVISRLYVSDAPSARYRMSAR